MSLDTVTFDVVVFTCGKNISASTYICNTTRGLYFVEESTMTAPRVSPTGMVNVVSTAQLQGKLELFGFGVDPRAINPGDLLIVTSDFVGENMHRQKVEFSLRLRGRDMHLVVEAAKTAQLLWDENQHWLNASINTPGLDQRGKSEIRLSENLENIAAFYPLSPRI